MIVGIYEIPVVLLNYGCLTIGARGRNEPESAPGLFTIKIKKTLAKIYHTDIAKKK